MRKTILKTVSGAVLVALFVLTTLQIPVAGENWKEGGLQGESGQYLRAARLEGTWLVQVTIRNCQTGAPLTTFPSLVSYVRGGVVLETTSGIRPALRYPGQGTWRHVGGNHYTATFMFFRFNPDGTFAGTQRITQDIELSMDGDELNITASAEILDVNGILIGTGCVTSTATRFE